MRKIIAIVLAVVMIAAMSVTVFAADLNNDAPVSNKIPVTYAPQKGFLVVIPDSIPLNDEGTNGDTTASDSIAGGEATVTIEKAKLNSGETLTVTVESENGWKLKDSAEADDIVYSAVVTNTLNNGGINDVTITAQKNEVVKYTSSATNITDANKPTSKMTFTTEFSNQAGNFSDNLTFTVTVA